MAIGERIRFFRNLRGMTLKVLGTAVGFSPNTAEVRMSQYEKGLRTPEEIAAVIEPQFPETDLKTITTIVTRYYDQDTWKSNLIFEESSFDLLQDILESAGELAERVPYDDLVTTQFAAVAAQ